MIYVFQCPLCRKKFRSGSRFEPCCTGPSENHNEHPMEVMHLLQVQRDTVDPRKAAASAAGPLILPPGFKYNA